MGKPSIQTIEEYINQYPDEIQGKLIKLRKLINQTAPAAREKLSWGLPAYYQKGFLVEFGVLKNYIIFYCTPTTIKHFSKDAAQYKTNTKNTVQFPVDQELPLELIEQMIRFRLKENGS